MIIFFFIGNLNAKKQRQHFTVKIKKQLRASQRAERAGILDVVRAPAREARRSSDRHPGPGGHDSDPPQIRKS